MSLTPKNWSSFQHYKDRSPSWIKLHRGLLDDFTFSRLPVASRALAPLLWLLASEYDGGEITASTEELAFRLRMTHDEMILALSPLIESGFFNASEPLADCKQSACLEKRREEEENIDKRERQKETREVALLVDPNEFNIFWEAWPNKVGKPTAVKALAASRKRGTSFDTIMDGLRRYIRDKPPDRPWLNPATFLNQERWADQPAATLTAKPLTAHQQKQAEGKDILNDIDQFISSRSGEADTRLLRHHSGDGPESLRGGAGGDIIELSAGRSGTGS